MFLCSLPRLFSQKFFLIPIRNLFFFPPSRSTLRFVTLLPALSLFFIFHLINFPIGVQTLSIRLPLWTFPLPSMHAWHSMEGFSNRIMHCSEMFSYDWPVYHGWSVYFLCCLSVYVNFIIDSALYLFMFSLKGTHYIRISVFKSDKTMLTQSNSGHWFLKKS